MKRFLFLILAASLFSCEATPTGKSPANKIKKKVSAPSEEPVDVIDAIEFEIKDSTIEDLPPPPEAIEMEDWMEEEEIEVPEEIIIFPSKEADYPGGTKALIEFITGELMYPEIAIEMGIEGTVFVQFSVQKDGGISKIHVLKGVQDYLDREAVRVIRRMPKWNPEEKEGKRIESVHTIPIGFHIN